MKLKKFTALNPRSISEHSSIPNEEHIELHNHIEAKVLELEDILKMKATKEDIQVILKEMENLKQIMKPSAGFEWQGRIADIIAVLDASIKVFALLM